MSGVASRDYHDVRDHLIRLTSECLTLLYIVQAREPDCDPYADTIAIWAQKKKRGGYIGMLALYDRHDTTTEEFRRVPADAFKLEMDVALKQTSKVQRKSYRPTIADVCRFLLARNWINSVTEQNFISALIKCADERVA